MTDIAAAIATLDPEIARTLWLTPEELRASLPRHRSPLLMRCVDDHHAGRRHPLDLVFSDPSVGAPPLPSP